MRSSHWFKQYGWWIYVNFLSIFHSLRLHFSRKTNTFPPVISAVFLQSAFWFSLLSVLIFLFIQVLWLLGWQCCWTRKNNDFNIWQFHFRQIQQNLNRSKPMVLSVTKSFSEISNPLMQVTVFLNLQFWYAC